MNNSKNTQTIPLVLKINIPRKKISKRKKEKEEKEEKEEKGGDDGVI